MIESGRERFVHKIFVLGVLLKAFDGILEIIAGIAVFFSGSLATSLNILVQNELLEDPHDLVAGLLQHVLPFLVHNIGLFAALYLLSHGVVKIFVVVGLLRDKLWAYPTALIIFSLFVIYQIYSYSLNHSLFMIFLTLLDLAVIALTWHEYQYFKKHHTFPQ